MSTTCPASAANIEWRCDYCKTPVRDFGITCDACASLVKFTRKCIFDDFYNRDTGDFDDTPMITVHRDYEGFCFQDRHGEYHWIV